MFPPLQNPTFFYNPHVPILPQKTPEKKPSPIFIESIFKSGTHLMTKVATLFDITQRYGPVGGPNGLESWEHLDGRYRQHENGATLKQLFPPSRRFFVQVRDPRDLVISFIFYTMRPRKNDDSGFKPIVDEKLDLGKLLDQCLDYQNLSCDPKRYLYRGSKTLFEGFEMAVTLNNSSLKNLLFTRFEDLVPPFAGGSPNKVRFRVFKRMANFAHLNPSDEKIRSVMKDCWGNTTTFRKGEKKKVGQWKKYFEPRHIQMFQEKYNHILLSLGYETDPNWHIKYLKEFEQNENQEIDNPLLNHESNQEIALD